LVGAAGATWSTDGFIYADANGSSALVRVPAAGGRSPEWFTRLDSAFGERDHLFPEALPNGRGVLFIVNSTGGVGGGDEIAVASTATGEHTRLLRGVYVRYAKSGHLIYVTVDGSLMAVPFDQRAMKLTGDPVALASGITRRDFGVPDLAVADDGTLMYTLGGSSTGGGEPVWVSRDGRAEVVTPDWTQNAFDVSLSADGRQMAVAILAANESNIWVRRLGAGGAPSKLTFQGNQNVRPSWAPDNRTLYFISNRTGTRSVHSQRADGTSESELVAQWPNTLQEAILTADGRWLVFRGGGGSSADIYARRTSGDTVPIVLANSTFPETAPTVSPDGRWLAYTSRETGKHEVYVRPFPEVRGGKWLASIAGGSEPLWSRDGRELFYRNGNDEMVAVAVAANAASPVGTQRVLFSTRGYATDLQHRVYDVTPDGRRFLMVRLGAGTAVDASELIVVQNFFEELKRLVPRR
jgi:serine/threonine-protein kinase